ncbi:MAG: hypothetical protein M1840_002114 [Geoglossum simile]|nr:MAG: hypothetical protein M1840_002114 [Geoglossum simile]
MPSNSASTSSRSDSAPPTTTPSSTGGLNSTAANTTMSTTAVAPGWSPQSPRKGTVSRVPPGTTAGIAVGVAVIAALLGAIITFYLLRLCYRPSDSSNEAGSSGYAKSSGHASSSGHRSFPGRKRSRRLERRSSKSRAKGDRHSHELKPSPQIFLDDYLPQPAEDVKLERSVATLSREIDQHVHNYYHRSEVSPADINALDASFPQYLGAQRAGGKVLMSPDRRWIALRQYISAVVIYSISPNGDPNCTLLPKELVALAKVMEELPSSPDPAIAEARSQWRVLSSFLLNPIPTAFPIISPSKPPRAFAKRYHDSSISLIRSNLTSKLRPFAIKDREADRARHLEDILVRAAGLGNLLFEQKENWSFCWKVREEGGRIIPTLDGGAEVVVVFPSLTRGDGALVRMADMEQV